MAEFRHVRRILVSLWGERVGTIVPMDSRQTFFAFQYERKFLKSSEDPWSAHGGYHQLSVNGKQSKITDDDLLAVADRFAIGTAPRVLGEVKSALS